MNNDDAIELQENEQLASIDEMAEELEQVAQPEESDAAQAAPQEDALPEKYRGKSATDIAKMHIEAERLLGRQGAELGELRRLTDDVIKKSFAQPSAPANGVDPYGFTPKEEEVDLFTDPAKAVSKIVENHPKIRELEAQQEFERRQANLNKLEETHPDYHSLVQTEEFQKWIGGSKIRSMLFAKANADFDFDAANELFDTFKALKNTKASTEADRDIKLAQGQTMPRGRTMAGDNGFESSRKIWSRAEIIRLHQTDPRKYEELQPLIMKAYAERRVR